MSNKLKGKFTELIDERPYLLDELDEVSSAQASTNASEFTLDNYEIIDPSYTEADETYLGCCELSFTLKGEPLEDKIFAGDTLIGQATVYVDYEDQLVFENVSCHVDDSWREELPAEEYSSQPDTSFSKAFTEGLGSIDEQRIPSEESQTVEFVEF